MQLDTFQTIFLVKNKTVDDVLDALSSGRVYAVRKSKEPRLVLDKFTVIDTANASQAIMGQELVIKGLPILEGRIS